MNIITIDTNHTRDVVDITDCVNDTLSHHPPRGELCHLFIRHTTAALTTVPIDPAQELDLVGIIDAVVPHNIHSHIEPDRHTHITTHLPPDILGSFVGASLAIPVKDGRLLLGSFQRVVVVEFSGPGKREVVIIGE